MRYGRLRAYNVPATSAPGIALALPARLRLCGWSLQAASGGNAPSTASTAIAAAQAGILTLTNFTAVASVTVTPTAAWPAGVNQVTVTNLAGGTVTVDIEGGTENAVIITFVPAVGVTGTPVVSVPAIVGGPAYTIDAEGSTGGAGNAPALSNATISDAGTTLAMPSALAGLTSTIFLSDMGVEVTSGLTVTVNTGTMQGAIWARECWPDDDSQAEAYGDR